MNKKNKNPPPPEGITPPPPPPPPPTGNDFPSLAKQQFIMEWFLDVVTELSPNTYNTEMPVSYREG